MCLLPFLQSGENGGYLGRALKLARKRELLYLGYVMWWVLPFARGKQMQGHSTHAVSEFGVASTKHLRPQITVLPYGIKNWPRKREFSIITRFHDIDRIGEYSRQGR